MYVYNLESVELWNQHLNELNGLNVTSILLTLRFVKKVPVQAKILSHCCAWMENA